MTITALLPEHWPAVKAIYEDGLATGNATFQTSAPPWEEWNTAHMAHSRLVSLDGSTVTGWTALTQVSARAVYRGVAEVSVYVSARHTGRGIGKALLQALITESERNGIWTLQAGIFPENTASVQLHLGAGFRQIGFREKIGRMGDRWRDTALFERRSKTVGI